MIISKKGKQIKNHLFLILLLPATVILIGCADDSSTDTSTNSSAKAITAFSFDAKHNTTLDVSVTAAMDGANITAEVPVRTDLTVLVANFDTSGISVTVEGAEQESGVTANDFTDPVTYTVAAADGSSRNYVVTVPVSDYMPVEKSVLHASDMDEYDRFGHAVAIDDNTAVISAIERIVELGGNSAIKGGAYVFERVDGIWTETQFLEHGIDTGFAGNAVAVGGDSILIGSYTDSASALQAGTVYLFEKGTGEAWSLIKELTPSDAAASARFGSAVAIDGDVAVIGAQNALNDSGMYRYGKAYVYERATGETWSSTETRILSPSDATGDTTDQFGCSAAVSADIAIIGAYGKNNVTGAVYVFERQNDGTWAEKQILTASDGQVDDQFGISVAISGSYAVIGANTEDGGDGDPAQNTGAAYIFERQADGTWVEQQILRDDNQYPNIDFGVSVSISGEVAVVGAKAGHGRNVEGNFVTSPGAIYVYQRDDEGAWPLLSVINASDLTALDHFGRSVAVDEYRIVCGAPYEDGGADNLQTNSGAAYFFE